MQKNKGTIWAALCAIILIIGSLSPILTVSAHDTHHTDEYVDIIVRYYDSVPSEEELDPGYKNVRTLELLPIQTMSVPASAIKEISQQPNVKRVTYDQEIETSETTREVAADDWNQDMIGTFDAWDEGYFGDQIEVAVLDTGFYNHPDITYAGGFSVFDEEHELGPDEWTNDHEGHGTHVAGIIAAHPGTRGQGIAPNVNLYGIKIYHRDRGNRTTIANLMAGLEWAILQGVDIINISSGYPAHNQEMKEWIDIAVQNDILVVAASGNMTDDNPDIDYPAAYPEVIAVSNVDHNYAHVFDSMISELNELAAPGQSIIGLGTPADNADYITMSGTSQATPHVVGIAALLMQKYPDESASQIRARMQEKAMDLGEEGFDSFFGHGLVQYSPVDLPVEEDEPEEEPETSPEEDNEGDEDGSESSEPDDESGADNETDESEDPALPDDSTDEVPEEGEEDLSENDESVSEVVEEDNENETDGEEDGENSDVDDPSSEEEASEEELEDDESESETDDATPRSTVWIRPAVANGVATVSPEDIESVGDSGVLAVSFDSTLSHVDRLHLSSADIQEIKERNVTILIARMDMEWVIPADNLDSDDALLIFEHAGDSLPYLSVAKSDPLSFSIEQNGARETVFPASMTYRFFTNEAEVNQDYLYEWDTETEEWVVLGDRYTNGGVMGSSHSTATLAVFNPDDLSAAINNTRSSSSEEENNEEEDSESASESETEAEEVSEERSEVEENALNLPVALSGAVVILAAVGGGFYFFGGKPKE
ncbi:hypothetical protein GCM10008932_18970 [Alkalibacterium iburiense]|uniref:Peptidase S8/S53 domain-containing protein n=1 Tax=Alkalibacterium iburiense TaxID=290589 RepID=A0ABP3HCG3_9LACT